MGPPVAQMLKGLLFEDINSLEGEIVMLNVSRIIIVVCIIFLFSGCSTTQPTQHLNDPLRSHTSLDVASISSPEEIPYETKEGNILSVSYNLSFDEGDEFSGYRLTLVFQNLSASPIVIKPGILLQDASGFLIQSYTYEAFINEAAILAGTNVPIRSNTSGVYKPPTSGGAAGSFAQGLADGWARGSAQAAANQAQSDRDEGKLMLRWANSYWLKSSYELPPGASISGALYFPANRLGKLPLHLIIETGIERFDFSTISNL